MSHFIKGHKYRCIHNLECGGWFSTCHFTKGRAYTAYSDYGILDDEGAHIGFPAVFDVDKYFVEDNEAV